MDDTPETRSPLAPLGWAFYLACSWTWCIGMFLPVLLIRDFGAWGYVVFAVPNVLGAAAMGWVLRSREQARRLAHTHREAVALFSVVTIAFHAYWLAWAAMWIRGVVLLPQTAWLGIVVGAIALVIVLGVLLRRGPVRAPAAIIWLISIGVLISALAAPADAIAPATSHFVQARAGAPGADVLWLAPVCLFGFALCPYLDGTFLLARVRTSAAGARAAFTLGFGVLFAAMIALTFVYAGLFASMTDHDPATVPQIAPWLGALLVAHLLAQAIFTVEVHHERLDKGAQSTAPPRANALLMPLVIVAVLAGLFQNMLPMVGDMFPGEVIYRVFMSAYGLLFPAYVWICMIPTRDGHAGITGVRGRAKLIALAIAVVVAAPAYWVGFIVGHDMWLGAGLGVVLLARLPVMLTRGPTEPSPA
ncbi:MAG: hypothetical protein DHS20C14_18160 [Phycisphaeraceae bacterium]|nr:MAG: hypothetical protein DHS20C14_18160 [Phycisphaeraceae bacterium]